jgi:hypothetical protein
VAALNPSEIPSHINTYERLLVFAAQAMANIANGESVNVEQGRQEQRLASCVLGTTADGVDRFVVSAYLPVNMAELNAPDEKTWMAALDVSTARPHVNFLSN